MLAFTREVGLFLKSVLWKWWGLMSCALWTFAAIYGEIHRKPDAWYVHASFGLAIAIVCLSTFLAWREQYKRVEALNVCLNGYQGKTFELTLVSDAAWKGNHLFATAPGDEAEIGASDIWRRKVEAWTEDTRELLRQLSPIGANKFTHVRRSPNQEFHGVLVSLWGDLSLLQERLDNLTDIMERANIYLARMIDRPSV